MRKGEPSARPVFRWTGGEDPSIELAYYADNTLLHADTLTDEQSLHCMRIFNEWGARKVSKGLKAGD